LATLLAVTKGPLEETLVMKVRESNQYHPSCVAVNRDYRDQRKASDFELISASLQDISSQNIDLVLLGNRSGRNPERSLSTTAIQMGFSWPFLLLLS
jgi:hypothetical protein